MGENGNAGRSAAARTLLMTAVGVSVLVSAVAWFKAGDKVIGAVQMSIGGLVGVVAIVYGRLSNR